MSVWVVEYQTKVDGPWKVSEPFVSERIAVATCLDKLEDPYRLDGWSFRVTEYMPGPPNFPIIACDPKETK